MGGDVSQLGFLYTSFYQQLDTDAPLSMGLHISFPNGGAYLILNDLRTLLTIPAHPIDCSDISSSIR